MNRKPGVIHIPLEPVDIFCMMKGHTIAIAATELLEVRIRVDGDLHLTEDEIVEWLIAYRGEHDEP